MVELLYIERLFLDNRKIIVPSKSITYLLLSSDAFSLFLGRLLFGCGDELKKTNESQYTAKALRRPVPKVVAI